MIGGGGSCIFAEVTQGGDFGTEAYSEKGVLNADTGIVFGDFQKLLDASAVDEMSVIFVSMPVNNLCERCTVAV